MEVFEIKQEVNMMGEYEERDVKDFALNINQEGNVNDAASAQERNIKQEKYCDIKNFTFKIKQEEGFVIGAEENEIKTIVSKIKQGVKTVHGEDSPLTIKQEVSEKEDEREQHVMPYDDIDIQETNVKSEMKRVSTDNVIDPVAGSSAEKILLPQTRLNRVPDLRKYIIIENGERQFECDICHKRFNIPSSFRRHQQIHSGEKRHECNTCHKKFTLSEHLKRHTRVHDNYVYEKLYDCYSCRKTFNDLSKLKRHVRTHCDENPYRCNVCQKSCHSSSDLMKHQRIHTGEKPYECSICQTRFNYASALNRHQRIHSGEKPYECNVCQKSFADGSAMKRHQRIHSGERPYECNTCQKLFSDSSALKKHQRVHNR